MDNDAQATQPQAPADPAALAFEALREEVALLRRGVAGLAGERAAIEIPDYSETLGQIMRTSAATAAGLKALGAMPALRLTAQDWGHEIAAASEPARHADQEALTGARDAFQQAAHDMSASLSSARLADNQRRWLLWTGAVGILAGMLLWAIGAGTIARAMPERWYWPERMAARILRLDREEAGARLIETAAPDRWRDIVLGYRIVSDNRDAIVHCQEAATHETKPTRCVVEVGKINPK